MEKHCKICGKKWVKPYGMGVAQWRTRKFCSRDCYYKGQVGHKTTQKTRKKISESLKNENHFNWKEKPTYGIVHYWLKQNFGTPNKCVFCREKKTCQWALLKGKEYERKRENFIRLCKKCHSRYDWGDKYKGKPRCLDCGKELTFYAKRCQKHAQQLRFNQKKGVG